MYQYRDSIFFLIVTFKENRIMNRGGLFLNKADGYTEFLKTRV